MKRFTNKNIHVFFFVIFSQFWRETASKCEQVFSHPPPLKPERRNAFGAIDGVVVSCGGGLRDIETWDLIRRLAGGKDAKIVYVPTADGSVSNDDLDDLVERFRATNGWIENQIIALHTRDRNIANSQDFVKPLIDADLVWFDPGRQNRLADVYLNTLTHDMFLEVLKRGKVIGGTSAGGAILSDFLARGDHSNQVVGKNHLEGFGFLHNIALDVHTIQRNRVDDMAEYISYFKDKKEDLLGISVDAHSCAIFQGNMFKVSGPTYVIVTDETLWSKKQYCSNGVSFVGRPRLSNQGKYFFLGNGDIYDVHYREVIDSDKTDFLEECTDDSDCGSDSFCDNSSQLCFSNCPECDEFTNPSKVVSTGQKNLEIGAVLTAIVLFYGIMVCAYITYGKCSKRIAKKRRESQRSVEADNRVIIRPVVSDEQSLLENSDDVGVAVDSQNIVFVDRKSQPVRLDTL